MINAIATTAVLGIFITIPITALAAVFNFAEMQQRILAK